MAYTYEKCAECHLFIEENYVQGDEVAEYVHLHAATPEDEALDGSHDATPSGQVHPLLYWKEHGPAAMRARFN